MPEKRLSIGQFSPDMLPPYLREHEFQVSIWCPNHKMDKEKGYPEMEYVYANYDKDERRLSLMGKCKSCGYAAMVGIEV